MEEITYRSILTEKLNQEEMLLSGYSKAANKREPLRGFENQFYRQQVKCRLIRELMQTIQAEPVKAVMAQWQREIMTEDDAGKPHGLTV